jgi:hypothetical protein
MTDQPTATPDAPEARPFAAILQEQRQGAAHDELTKALQDVVAGVLDTGKMGTLTLALKVKPSPDGISVLVFDEVKAKVPENDRPASIFYGDDNGNLHRTDPRQTELPNLRSVDRDTGEVREAPAAPIREADAR